MTLRQFSDRWLVILLLLSACAYALAEDITLTTYYPSPRGVYDELKTMGQTLLAQSGGNVGIGTASPVTKLEVNGAVRLGNFPDTNPPAGTDGALYFDTTFKQVMLYNGGWQNLSVAPGTLRGHCLLSGGGGPPGSTNLYQCSGVTAPAVCVGPAASDQSCACQAGYTLVNTGFYRAPRATGCSDPPCDDPDSTSYYSCMKN